MANSTTALSSKRAEKRAGEMAADSEQVTKKRHQRRWRRWWNRRVDASSLARQFKSRAPNASLGVKEEEG